MLVQKNPLSPSARQEAATGDWTLKWSLVFPSSLGAVSDSYQWDTRAAEPRATLRCIPRLSELLPGDGCGQERVCQGAAAGTVQVAGSDAALLWDGFLEAELEGIES